MSTPAPIALILDSESSARLGEYDLLPWWVQNISGQALDQLRMAVEVVGAVQDLVIHPGGTDRLGLPDGGIRRLSTAYKALSPGRYALRVRAEVHVAGAAPVLWECPDEISLVVGRQNAQGQVNMVFEQPGVLKGYLPPGNYTFKSEMLVKPEAGSDGVAPASPLGVANALPPDAHRLALHLVPVPAPGLGARLDLGLFARHWQDTQRPQLAGFQFVDQWGQPRRGPAHAGDCYRLRLQSYRGGHITLVTQGSSGRYFQLLPHRHWGQQVVAGHQGLLFPDDMLRNLGVRSEGGRPDPADNTKQFLPLSGKGQEHALVIVSPQPITGERSIFVADGQTPDQVDEAGICQLLGSLLHRPEAIELGYAQLQVLA